MIYDLASTATTIAQAFTFAAYGNMLAVHDSYAASVAVSSRPSSLGYSGEHFDAKAQQQYLRARFYDPSNGRFNRLDPFAGNIQDPQSLHKYAYVHGDPVQGVDPTGEFIISVAIGIGIATALGGNKNLADLSAGASIIGVLATVGLTIPAGVAETNLYYSGYNHFLRHFERRQATGQGGKDITNQLLLKADGLMRFWSGLSLEESRRYYLRTLDPYTGWDILPLQAVESEQRMYFADGTFENGQWARRSVTVDGAAYYAHEVNYFMFGILSAEAKKRGGLNTQTEMEFAVEGYRIFYANLRFRSIEHDGDEYGRSSWARAGWKYSMTGEFDPPRHVRLPNAYPSQVGYDSRGFEMKIGDEVLPF